MHLAVHITYRHLPLSEPLSNAIREQAGLLLDRDDVLSCHVIVEPERNAPSRMERCRVRIEVSLPGKILVADRWPPANRARDDIYNAVRQAFRILRRKLG